MTKLYHLDITHDLAYDSDEFKLIYNWKFSATGISTHTGRIRGVDFRHWLGIF